MAICLNGTWKLSSLDGKYENIPFEMPGDIHSALIKAKIIDDPYFGTNEKDQLWVGQSDWCAVTTFSVSQSFLKNRQFITLHSADTFVRVFINGAETGFCSNYFCKWRFDITENLKPGENTVKLVFESAEKHAAAAAAAHPYPVPDQPAPVYSPHRNFVRKTQCHGGWDWGPCIMAIGVYQPILIEQISWGFLDYAEFNAQPKIADTFSGEWAGEIALTVTALQNCTKTFSIEIAEDDWDLFEKTQLPSIKFTNNNYPAKAASPAEKSKTVFEETFTVQLQKGENRILRQFCADGVKSWFVAGTFPQNIENQAKAQNQLPQNSLYNLNVSAGKQKICKKVAFRQLKAIAKEDQWGKSLYFENDGRAIYAKGSNWIPCDALPSRQTYSKYLRLLNDMVLANQNCIRVWGGGQYENEDFYAICDKLGIMVWQDCMFSCSLYPANPEFLASVKAEIEHQVRRLQSHPSIVLWCGNNELVGAFNWFEPSRNNRDRYLIDYDRLNEGVLGAAIAKYDPNRAWWPSSPSAGPGDYADNWHQDGRGDMHYWSVWHEGKPFEAYYEITPRFVSEFGYQSFPSLESVKTYASPDQFNLTSPVMEYHQKNQRGNSIIIENFTRYFRLPEGFENMLYLSQVQQAMAIKTAVEYWRTLRPRCMGSIIWQLNDVWPVASWSSIEYKGNWKVLHYDAKDFFAPVSVILFKKDEKIWVYCVNDSGKAVEETLTLQNMDFAGNVLKTIEQKVCIEKDSARQIFCFEQNDFEKQSFLFAKLGNLAVNTLFLCQPKEAALKNCQISTSIKEIEAVNGAQRFEIAIKSNAPAFFTNLYAPGISGLFSKNNFTLLPDTEEKIIFTLREPVSVTGKKQAMPKITLKRLQNALKVITLRDTYK